VLQQAKTGDVTFRETMSGPFARGITDPAEGAKAGRLVGWRLTLHATVTVSGDGPAALVGEVRLPGLRRPIPFEGGTFLLFPGDGELMRYELGFTHDGTRYHLTGIKTAGRRPFLARLWPDTTTLYTRLSRDGDGDGDGDGDDGDVVGAGVLRLGIGDLVRLMVSMRAPGANRLHEVVRAIGGFLLRFTRGLAEMYLLRK
jgi:hypothetical protein